MSITTQTAGTSATAAWANSIKDHLEGASGSTLAYHFRVLASNNFLITLSDSCGGQKFSVRDFGGNEVASIDSDGDFAHAGTYSPGTITPTALVLPLTTAPAQTTLGCVKFDSDDFRITVGTGAGRQIFYPGVRVVEIIKCGNETVSTGTTLQNDDCFVLAVGACEEWIIHTVLDVTQSTSDDSGFKFAYTVPSGGTISGTYTATTRILSCPTVFGRLSARSTDLTTAPTIGVCGVSNSAIPGVVEIHAVYKGSSTAGNVQLQWTKFITNCSNTTVAGTQSYMVARQVDA